MAGGARFFLLAACAAFACAASGGDVRAKRVLRRPMERVASMDPLRAASVCDAQAVGLVYEPLLEVDYRARPYALKPCTCSLPETSADGRVYTFRMAEGVRFTNGRDATAEDVVYSLKRLSDKSNASAGMWLMDGVESVSAPDARTVRIALKRPLHVFPWLMSMPYAAVVPREEVEAKGGAFGLTATGTGPYKLASWRRNHEMTFVRNPDWRGWKDAEDAEHAIDEIRYLVVDDASTQWLMFLSGQLDFLGAVSRDNWDAVVGTDGLLLPELAAKGMTLHASSSLSLFYVGINMKDPVAGQNRKLRQALNCAFDYPQWQRHMNNRCVPSTGPVPPGTAGRLETPFAYAYDEEKAKKLLAEAGYPGGVDPKTGRRLHLELTMGKATNDAREMAELMQSFYARVGVDFETKYMTWDAYLRAVNEGRTQFFYLGWIGDYPDAENFLQLFCSKNVSPGANHGYYVNPAYDKAYEAALAAKTEDARNALWSEAQEIVREDCPWIFLYTPKIYSLVWNRVKGYVPSDFPYGCEKHWRLRD